MLKASFAGLWSRSANILIFRSTLPVVMTHRIWTPFTVGFFGVAVQFGPFSLFAVAGASFTVPGYHRSQLKKDISSLFTSLPLWR